MPSSSLLPRGLTLGIVAHVDAGKTSLTERLLYEAGVVDSLGRVDDGTTQTDSLDLERRRGITIRASVTSFWIDDLTVTMLDTPGHPDFIAEVERSLAVLDAAVLVISAVEGVQPQTIVLWRALQRLQVPTVLFVNKVDRSGADPDRVLDEIRRRLTSAIVPMATTDRPGTMQATVTPIALDTDLAVEAIAGADDRLLERWLEGRVRRGDALHALRRQLLIARLTPVLTGSAVTGAGIALLQRTLRDVVPRPRRHDDRPFAATVFAVDRTAGVRRTWLRVWSGELRLRQRPGPHRERVTAIEISGREGLHPVGVARAGEVAVVSGLSRSRIGDRLGEPGADQPSYSLAPPTLHALVSPVDPTQRGQLFAALAELADEDPLIDLRLDEVDAEPAITLHGEVQQEVIAALLESRYGVAARFSETSVVCLERVTGTGEAWEEIRRHDNPYLATIGLRIEPAPVGGGVEFHPGIERGNLPPAFIAATEEGVRAGLRQGSLGWQVTDCLVTMTKSGYWPRQSRPHQKFDKSISSVAADFRLLSQVVLARALARAGSVACQPIDRFELEVPDAATGGVLAVLGNAEGQVLDSGPVGDRVRLVGEIPSGAVADVTRRLPDLTGGEGVLVSQLDHHRPMTGRPATRRRSGVDPTDREAWFRAHPR